MAALGTNMGKKSEKKSETPALKKPKKKDVQAKEKVPNKALSKLQTKKSQKAKATAPSKKVTVKTSVAKKSVATKPSSKVNRSRPTTKAQKQSVKTKTKVSKAVTAKKIKAESAPKKIQQKLKLRNAKLILEPSKRKKIRKTKVILEGDLSINNLDAFMSQIEPIFDDYDYVDFFQRGVTALDLCHIQMLYYFQNNPKRKGKTVTVNSELPPDLKKVVTNAGFKEFMFIPKLV